MTTVKWTQDSAEGFTDAELAILQEAQDMLEAELADSDDDGSFERSLADELNNVWRPGLTAADLYTTVRDRLGLNA